MLSNFPWEYKKILESYFKHVRHIRINLSSQIKLKFILKIYGFAQLEIMRLKLTWIIPKIYCLIYLKFEIMFEIPHSCVKGAHDMLENVLLQLNALT